MKKSSPLSRIAFRTITTIQQNWIVFALVILAMAGLLYFASLEYQLPSNKWNSSAYGNFASATATPTLMPSQGWWTNIKPPTPKP